MRSAFFGFDLVGRNGILTASVTQIVDRMIRVGAAQIVMGNHQFKALGSYTPDVKGGYLCPHTKKNWAQHAATLSYFEKNPGAMDRGLTWFYFFPLWLDLGFARIVHAAWSPAAMLLLKTPYLTLIAWIRFKSIQYLSLALV